MEVELSDVLVSFLVDWLPENYWDETTDSDSRSDELTGESSDNRHNQQVKYKRIKMEHVKRLAKKIRPSKPRYLSSDIRETYPGMFANTFNSCDLSLITGMCKRFYMPNVEMTVRKQVDMSPNNIFTNSGTGPMFIANLLYCCSTWYPDAVTTLTHSNFHRNSGVVSFNFTFSTTKVYNIPTIHTALPTMRVEPNGDVSATDDTSGTSEMSEADIVRSLEKVKASMPLRKKPVKVVFRCNIKMVTNQHKRVEQFKLSIFVVENDFSVEEA